MTQWGLSVQQALPKSFVGTLSYVGSKGTNLLNTTYINLKDPTTGLRPYPAFGQIHLPLAIMHRENLPAHLTVDVHGRYWGHRTERIDRYAHVTLVCRADIDNDRMIFRSSSGRVDLVLLRPQCKEDAEGQSCAQENGHYPL
ncbi:hypothetical protein BDD14_5301 [Edaphobacter modestus]|uniref:TonB-dependent transporter Oar-like beta-barrel domain-containing protein n=1 Tax=Edaphobacter modestus TaxID=388466 RepID=A0A4Q7Z037_9BACT|nr:hypothetical protein BDD14_5301 [Edaphobacter modestus]